MHDSLFLLRHILQKTNQMRLHVMVALDLRRTYDTVTHAAVLEALADAYPGKRLNNFVRSFLANRTFEIRSGRHNTLHFDNHSRVPQGAILSPTLFNLVMTKLV